MIAEILNPDGTVTNTIVAEADFLEEAHPGAWREVVLPFDLAALKAARSAAVDAERDARLTGGFSVPAAASAALAGQVLQTRNAEDRLNWLVSESAYRDAVAAGQGEAMAAQFRNAANVTTTVAISEGLVVLKAMKAWGSAVMARSWAIKDAITAAADPASVEAVDITAGWPA